MSPRTSIARGTRSSLIQLAVLLASALLAPAAAQAQVADILMLSTTLSNPDNSVEEQEAVKLGFTVDVRTPQEWSALTAADFAKYRAIVLGDPDCSSDSAATSAAAAIANRSVWGPVVDGNVVIFGTDPIYHVDEGGRSATNSFINYAAAEAGKTGAYISLSCYGDAANIQALLDPFGTFGVQPGGGDASHIVAEHPALAGLTDATLANWGSSVHSGFTVWPNDFLVLAIARDIKSDFVAPDGTSGLPYTVARGESLQVLSDIDLTPEDAVAVPGGTVELTASVIVDDVPQAGVNVTFEVISGPNDGVTGAATTNAQGRASFSYSSALPGTDTVVARFMDANERTQTSNQATVAWTARFESGDWGEAFDTTETFVNDERRVLGFFAAQTDGVHILDLTNPANIAALGQYQPASCDADGVAVLPFADEVVFVESQQAIYVGLGPCGVHIVDVSDAFEPGFEPTLIGSFDTPGWVEKLAVVESGDQGTCEHGAPVLTHVADFDSVRILDTSDPASPVPCSSIDETDEALGDGPFLGVDTIADPATGSPHLGVAAADGLRLLDVSVPQEPVVEDAASYNTPDGFSPPEFAGFEVDVSQDVLTGTVVNSQGDLVSGAVLSSWAAGLQLLEFDLAAEGGSASEFFEHEPTESAVYASQPCGVLGLCVAEGQAGLSVLAYDDELGELTRRAAIPIGPEGAWAWDLAVRDCTAYVTWGETAGSTGGFDVVAIPDCEILRIVGGDPAPDSDGDGVPNAADNCVAVPNLAQGDADLDGYGGLCDADATGDGVVGVPDFAILNQAFGASAGDAGYHAGADSTDDGVIGIPDFKIFLGAYGSAPGPSGLACAGAAPCP